MELTHFDEQGYQLELHTYQTIFLDFKSETPSFVSTKNKTSSRVISTPSMVQPIAITKLVNPLKGGISLEIIPLLV